MKKIKKSLLFAVVTAVLMLGFAFGASALDEIEVNQEWTGSWGSNVADKYLYLIAPETGFYDISIEDLSSGGELILNFKDIDCDDDDCSWYNTGLYMATDDIDFAGNVYLMEGHTYELRLRYGGYNSDYDYIAMPADAKICIMSNDYEVRTLTFNKNENLALSYGVTEWLEFTTAEGGDYIFETNQAGSFYALIYDKTRNTEAYYMYFDDKTLNRIQLMENTEYLINVVYWENSSKLVRFKGYRAASDVTDIKIDMNGVVILGHNGYIFDKLGSLYWDDLQKLNYKITFSDKTSETLSYYGCNHRGINIHNIHYLGNVYEYGGENFFASGTQPAKVDMGGIYERSFSANIYITSYVEFVSNLRPCTDYDDMTIEYEDSNSHTYYWRLKPDETNNYEFYSYDWDQVDTQFTIFDKNNKVVPGNDGYNLKAGNEYCLRITYTYEPDCYYDVVFSLQPHRDHVHTYKNKCDTTCEVCGAVRTVTHTYSNACDANCNICGVKRSTKHAYSDACDKECNICKVTRKVTHSYTTTTTKATLKKNGKTVTKCKVCGYVSKTTTNYYPKTIKLSATTYTYNGKTKTPSVTVKDSKGKALKNGTDYTVTYPKKRKSIGKYTVTVTFKGKYSGTKKLTYEIVPAKVTLSKLTAGSKQLTATWKTVSGATGYEVVYSTSKKFTSKTTKKVTIKKAKTKKTTIKKLKKGKKYYVKVRAYKTVNKKAVYGSYSKVKSVTVK